MWAHLKIYLPKIYINRLKRQTFVFRCIPVDLAQNGPIYLRLGGMIVKVLGEIHVEIKNQGVHNLKFVIYV